MKHHSETRHIYTVTLANSFSYANVMTYPAAAWLIQLSRGTAFPTRLHVRPAKAQISLRIRTV